MALYDYLLIIILSTFMLGIASIAGGQVENNDPQAEIESLIQSLEKNNIERIEILQFSPEAFTRVALTQDMLETAYDYKIIIRGRILLRNKLLDVLRSIKVKTITHQGDLRYGVIFYGVKDERVASIYFEGNSNIGAVSGTPVIINGRFIEWLKNYLKQCVI